MSVIEQHLPTKIRSLLRHIFLAARQIRRQSSKECPVCDYRGIFIPVGVPIRAEGMCPKCASLERQRLIKLWSLENPALCAGKKLLHFAPEFSIKQIFQPTAAEYTTADITPGRADLTLNIEALDLPSESKDVVICFHVLEHVDDREALSEIYRILAPGGLALLMVPIIEGWDTSYENDAIKSPKERELHYGQYDHVRWYGRDFRERVRNAGLNLDEFVVDGAATVRYGLLAGERLFIATKPS